MKQIANFAGAASDFPDLCRVKEKRFAIPFVMASSLLFLAGGFFCFKYAFPPAFKFLLSMGGPSVIRGCCPATSRRERTGRARITPAVC